MSGKFAKWDTDVPFDQEEERVINGTVNGNGGDVVKNGERPGADRSLEQFSQAMLLDHPFDRFPIDTGLPRSSSHMAVVALQEVDQKTPLKRGDRRLFRMFERCRFCGTGT